MNTDECKCNSRISTKKKMSIVYEKIVKTQNYKSNEYVLRLFHDSFSYFSSNEIIASIKKALSKYYKKYKISHVVTGAGFGSICYDSTKGKGKVSEWENFGDSDYNTIIFNITEMAKCWGKDIWAQVSNFKADLIIGVDVNVKYDSGCYNSTAQLVLFVSTEGVVDVVWKVYPTHEEESYLIYPYIKKSDMPNIDAYNSHYFAQKKTSIFVCNDIISYAKRGKMVSTTPAYKKRTELLKATNKSKLVFTLIHEISSTKQLSNFTNAYNGISKFSETQKEIGFDLDKYKGCRKSVVMVSGLYVKTYCTENENNYVKIIDSLSCDLNHIDVYIR